jgi:formylglycine-generating enzyme
MMGNVVEWVSDWYGETYYASSPTTDPTGPASGSNRTVRGGEWNSPPANARASFRGAALPVSQLSSTGFRCAN